MKFHFVMVCLCQKRGWNSGYIHVLLDELWKIFMYYGLLDLWVVFMYYKYSSFIGTLSTQKMQLPLHWSKSGRCNG